MPTFSVPIFLITFLVLSCAPHPLSSSSTTTTTTIPNRRILHQPFLPQGSLPPSQPPSPSPPSPSSSTPPKIPFSTSTPGQSPFFPSYPSPPPPPSPATFASFPANISSLILPQSTKPKPTSQKLLVVAITAVISAIVVLGIIVFYYSRRRRNRNFADDNKTYRSDNSSRMYQAANAETRNSNSRKLRTTSTSSEFLYLGTLVDSRSINETANNIDNVGSDPRKLESPELRPLPPLNRQCSVQNSGNGEVGSTTGDDEEEEDEEFYSPRGSLGGRAGRESSGKS